MKISKNQIILILDMFEQTRNCDKLLIYKIKDVLWYKAEEISEAWIIRSRCRIQNDMWLYKPTDPIVYKKRLLASERSPFRRAKTFMQKLKINTKSLLNIK